MATVTLISTNTSAAVVFNRVDDADVARLARELLERCSSNATVAVGPDSTSLAAVRFIGNGIHFHGGHVVADRIGMGVGWLHTPSIVFYRPRPLPVRQRLLTRARRLFRR
ncbi:MAG: hypothetical protein M3Q75_06720 [Gemmatimonadota bacterium]|nr:hypothetical protein [Gemmatimonadota bacterium]